MWGFMYARNSEIWTWVAIDEDSRLVICWHVGDREIYDARVFIRELSKRVSGRVQITSDGLNLYYPAIVSYFNNDNVDYVKMVKASNQRFYNDW